MTDQPIVILGSGMGALGAASRLAEHDRGSVLYDGRGYPGGHTATFAAGNGFLFDDGPHVSFTKDERIRALLAANVGGEYHDIKARINNYWHGRWIPHPVQMHLYGLPTELVVQIIRDFVAVHGDDSPKQGDYETWLRAAYGDTFAETFPMVYGHKYHTTTMDQLTTDWLGPRMYRPSLEEMLQGALAPTETEVHYVTSFRYPTNGGFQAYLRPYLDEFDIRVGHPVTRIDTRQREVGFANGTLAPYHRLISSIPLPDLVPLIVNAPQDALAAAASLSFSSAVMVNVGVDREDISEAHISYVYDEEIIFPRLNFPHLLSRNNAPPGMASIQAELYFSDRYRPLNVAPESLIDDVVRDLRSIRVLDETDRVVVSEARFTRFANVIYDNARAPALAIVNAYLDEVGILRCGRYGDWNHSWTDESFVSGEQAGDRALS